MSNFDDDADLITWASNYRGENA